MKINWSAINMAALLLVLVVNALASLLPINNQTTAEISNSFPVIFKPAGFVFSIWGLIYLLLIIFVVYQVLHQKKPSLYISAIGGYFALSCLLNATWLFAWHYDQFLLSSLIMVLLLLTLIAIYVRINSVNMFISKKDKWLIKLPFSIYLAWISVATIANISITLFDLNWGGWGLNAVLWTVIMLVAGSVLAVYMTLAKRDSAFGLVFIWAFIGIYIEQKAIGIVWQTSIALAFFIAAAVLYLQLNGSRIKEYN